MITHPYPSAVLHGTTLCPLHLEKQVTSSSELEAHCTGRPGLCLLALLDSTAPGYEAERKVGAGRGGADVRGGSLSTRIWRRMTGHMACAEARLPCARERNVIERAP